MTSRQAEVLEELAHAVSRKTATWVAGDLHRTALGMAERGVLNLAQDDAGNLVFWIRQPRERATGSRIPAGFVVILNRSLVEPSGESVNFFLFRTKEYDHTQGMFRKLLSRWLKHLDLSQRDVLGSIPVEQVPYDAPMFENKGHIVLED